MATKQAVTGNPQLNIRIEKELLDKIKKAAESEGLTAAEWARRACLASLGESLPGGIGRGEFEAAIAELRKEIEELKKSDLAVV